MTASHWGAVLVAVCACAPAGVAQTVAFRIGPGLAHANGPGWSGLVALEGRWPVLIVRADAHMVYVPNGAAAIGYGGLAAGASLPAAAVGGRPYVLATVARGVDVREADALTTVGIAAGLDWRSHLFAELRYEHALARAHPIRYRLPAHQLTLCAGVRIGRW